jgi:hypothetical protein
MAPSVESQTASDLEAQTVESETATLVMALSVESETASETEYADSETEYDTDSGTEYETPRHSYVFLPSTLQIHNIFFGCPA